MLLACAAIALLQGELRILPVIAALPLLRRAARALDPCGTALRISIEGQCSLRPAGSCAELAFEPRVRGRFARALWIEARDVRNHHAVDRGYRREVGRSEDCARHLLVFRDALSDGEWRSLRRALRLREFVRREAPPG